MAFRKKQPPSPSPWLARVIDQENEKLQIMNTCSSPANQAAYVVVVGGLVREVGRNLFVHRKHVISLIIPSRRDAHVFSQVANTEKICSSLGYSLRVGTIWSEQRAGFWT